MNKRFLILLCFFFLVAVLLTATCLGAASAFKEQWKLIRTTNFYVTGNVGEKELRNAGLQLEQFRRAFELIFPDTKLRTEAPTWIVVLSSHDAFYPFKPKYKGKIRENVGGYFLKGEDRNYIVFTNANSGYNPFEVIYHEYTHYIMSENQKRLPAWLNEGLAEFYSTFRADDDGQSVVIGSPQSIRLGLLRSYSPMPLARLLNVNRNSREYNEGMRASVFYSQSWALVHYLMMGEQGRRKAQLTEFIKRQTTGLTPEENFRQSFQMELKDLEKELSKYVNQQAFPATRYLFYEKLQSEKSFQSGLLSEAQTMFLSGDLQSRIGRRDEAEKFFRKALELESNHAESLLALGQLRLIERQYAEAKPLLERSLSLDPNLFSAWAYLGDLQLDHEQYADAVKSFEQAIKLRPNLASLHTQLGLALTELGETERASQELTRAFQLSPDESAIFRIRCYHHLNKFRGRETAQAALTYLTREGWTNTSSPYMALAAYAGYRMAKQDADADKVLNEWENAAEEKEWPRPVLEYLQRKITAEKLISKAGRDSDQLTEAHAYLGLDLMLSGKVDEAVTHFTWVRDKGTKSFVEYEFALAFLKKLNAR